MVIMVLGHLPAWSFVHLRQPAEIPMRDGRTLAADVYLPAATGTWPVVLIQTPYNKNDFALIFLVQLAKDPLLKSPDYAFVVLDWRGFFASAGAAYAGSPSHGEDGFDAVEWIAAQSWCNASVGTWGPSALGTVQLNTAAEHPPHLKAGVPMVYHFKEWYDQAYPGGVYARNRNDFAYGLFGGLLLIRAHPLQDGFWTILEGSTGDSSRIDVPMLHITGWYDHETIQTIREMQSIQANGGPGARGKQKILIGPWSHGHVGQSRQGELSYPAAEFASSNAALDFFDYYLRGINNDFPGRPVIVYFRMNDNIWQETGTWPPAGTVAVEYFLHPDGALLPQSPEDPDAYREYVAEPSDPVPTLFGAVVREATAQQGPGDLRPLGNRGDVLTFISPILPYDLPIEGNPKARLWIQCDAVDTDLAVRVTEVYPDGRSVLLADGIRRASLRHGYSSREFLQPSDIYEVEVDLHPIAVTIPAGHQVRVLIAPSNYDLWDVNPQDGSDLSDEIGVKPVKARVRLMVNALYPSHLMVPVVGRGGMLMAY